MSNKGSSLLVPAVLLLLCSSILPAAALDTGGGGEDYAEVDHGDGNTEGDPFLTVTNTSVLEENAFNTTEHRGFLHGFVESLSVILVSKIGDKTFFIAAILAMRNNKLTVFLAAISALAVMTVLSALLGFVVTTFIPREYTYYTCTAIMFLFGLKMLWEAWRMKPTEGEETQREVEEELARRGSTPSLAAQHSDEEAGTREEELQSMNPSWIFAGHLLFFCSDPISDICYL